jgi:DNA mismatch repair protein MutS2
VNPKTLTVLEFDKIRRRLADHTAFSGGRRLALALEPATEPVEVRRRLRRVTEARDYGDRRGNPGIEGAHDLRVEIEGARRGKILLPPELLEIRDTIGAARRIERAIGRERTRWPEMGALAERLEPCTALYDAIQNALDESGEVQDRASPRLRRIRGELKVAHDRLRRQVDGIVGATPREVLQEALVTQRNGRYVIPVKSEFRGRVPGVIHDLSDSGATVFVEPLAVVEHGNQVRQLELEEEKEIDRILRELAGFVAAEAEALGDTIAALGELDLVFACASYGYTLRAVTPEIVDADEPLLDFSVARHPLIDPDTVVPIDARVGQDFRQLVITGPNTGGKTVTLKTIGLLTLMAQAGLQIPAAEGARLTVFDGVFADIGDEQSIEQSLSTFSGHMTNIIGILGAADKRSLVLLDELGAGTDPVEGAALAGAILDDLRAHGITTVASTHYSELKAYAYATAGVANASVEFDLETLRPTYVLTIGLPGRSNALAIAERLGLPAPIIASARGGLGVTDVTMEDMLAEIRATRDQAARDRASASEARHAAEEWAYKLETAVREVEAERAEILNTARHQAQGEIDTARDAIQKLLRKAERGATMMEAIAEAGATLDEIHAILDEAAPEPEPVIHPDVAALEPGHIVRVKTYNQTGEVLRVLDHSAEVSLGRMKMMVPLSDLEILSAPPEAKLEREPRLKRSASAAPEVPIELHLRGMRVDEGLDALDRYLNQALLAGLPWVRIVHGHGTGAMKTAVRDALRRYPFVTSVRAGAQNEGGDGATVAYL